MSEGSNFTGPSNLVSFDRFTAFDIQLSFEPERWMRLWPTYIALVLPHLDPHGFISSFVKPPILESAGYRVLEVQGRPLPIVSLLFDGKLALRDETWRITHPRYPKIAVPIPDMSEVFLADSKTVSPDRALMCLGMLIDENPPIDIRGL